MKVLVTGSSGFIGTHVVRGLIKRKHEVLGLDRVAPDGRDGFAFEPCDIMDEPRLRGAFESFAPDAVVHLAARVDLDESRGIDGYAANIDGVRNVVRCVHQTKSVKRAIYTSTVLVCRIGHMPSSDTDYAPTTSYGASKVEGEKIVRAQDGGGCTWCIVRPTTVWGPGMGPHYQRFLGMIRRGTYVHVGSRDRLKSYGYVATVAHQYCQLLEASPATVARRVFYVGDYEPVSLRKWADKFSEAFKAGRITTIPEVLARAIARVGDGVSAVGFKRFPFTTFRLRNVLTESVYDLSKTRAVCGDVAYDLDEAVRLTAEWFLAAENKKR